MPAGKFNTSILEAEARTFNTSILADEVDMTPEDTARAQVQFEEEKPDLTFGRIFHGPWDELKKGVADVARGINLPSVYAKPEQDLARIARDEMIDPTFTAHEIWQVRAEIEKYRDQGYDFKAAKSMAMTVVAQKRGRNAQEVIEAHEKHLLPDLPTDDEIKAARARSNKKSAWLDAVANSKYLEMDPELEQSSGLIEDIARGIGSSIMPMMTMWANPVLGAHVMYEQIKGAKYEALVRDGVDEERANLAASRDAIVQTPLEFIGDMFVLKTALGGKRAWAKVVTDIAQASGAEGITEFAQQYPDELSTYWAMNPDMTIQDAWKEMTSLETLKRAAYAGVIGAAAGGIMAGGGHGINRALDRYVLEPQRKKNEEKLNLTLGALKKLKEGQALTGQEQDAVTGLDMLPQAFVDRMYYQTPVDTENRDRVYDGLLKSNITKEQADATITVIDAIAHHYAEVTGQTPEAFYDVELTDYRVGKFDEFNVDQERQAAQTRTQFQGGIPTDVDGNELVDMDGTPIPLNSDGTITLYHRTSKENADKINKTGNFISLENTNETFFSSSIEGQAEGYGDTVIAIRIKPSLSRINDAFHNGEVHVAISNKILSRRNIISGIDNTVTSKQGPGDKTTEATPKPDGGKYKDVILWRGEDEMTGQRSATMGYGLYLSRSLSKAKKYGKAKAYVNAHPRNPLELGQYETLDDWLLKDSGEKNIREFNKKHDRVEYLKNKGYDGVISPATEEVVNFNPEDVRIFDTKKQAEEYIKSHPNLSRPSDEGGKPSYQLRDVTDTPEFKKWFGDSKVVDKDGKPLVVYHGSPDARFMSEDSTFRNRWSGETKGAHWFTPSTKTAKTYADDTRAWDYQNSEPMVIPAYLSLKNPLIVDAKGSHWREAQKHGKTSDVIEKAQKDGHDGVIIRNVKDDYINDPRTKTTDTYVVFDSTQIKSVYNQGTFDPNNPNIMYQTEPNRNPLGATVFTSSGAIINAFEGNNVSTPIHEVGHVLVDLISRYDPESFAILCKYLGKDPAKGIGSWTTADHEKLAKAFETYMMQGKAPSFRLVTTFRKMKTWLLELYRRVTKLGVKVTPEVRGVFDKWLTTEDERLMDELSDITNLMDEQSPYYEELKKLKLTAIEQYEDLAAKAQAIVNEKDRQKRLIKINKARAQMRKHAEEIIDHMPYYQDIKTLRYLGYFSEDLVRGLRNYGEDHLQVFREKGVMSKTGKISPDAFVAEQDYVSEREYETAEEFLDMVLEMPTRKNAIEQKYDELEADFWESVEADGIKLDDASAIINAEIDLLYAMLGKSPVRAKLLSREIDKREELSGEDVRELKKLAADLERTAREAFDQGVTEQKGAQREAEAELKGKQKGEVKALKEKQKVKLDEMRAKNIEKVIALKEKQKDAIKRLREQNRVGAEKKKILARMKKHIRREGMLYENRQQLQALLSRYFKVRAYTPDAALPTLEGYFESRVDPELQAGEVIQDILQALPDPRRDSDGNSLTRERWSLADLETIAQVADMIVAMDAQERSNTKEMVQQERALLVDHIYAMADEKPKILPDGEIKVRQNETWMGKVRASGADLYASLRRIEFFCNFLDGFTKTGFAWTKIFKPTADAENHELRLHEVYDQKITAIMEPVLKDAAWFKQVHVLPGIKTQISRQNAFMIALNSGNKHNLNYLREGNRIPQETIDHVWDEFLTEAEKKAVGEIWDLFDTLYPMLNDVNKAILGAPLKKVEGHYFPIKTDVKDADRGHIAQKHEETQIAKDTGFGPHSFAYPEHSFRKARVSGMKEYPSLLLEASVIATHLDRTIHDISHTLPLLEVYRLIRDPQVMKAIKDVAGTDMYDQLTPWLRSISRPVSEPLGWQERASRHLRKTTSIVGMGFKLTVAALQPLDLFSTWYELGLKPTAKGIGHFFGGGFIRKVKAIDEASIMMRYRLQAYDREVADFKRKVLEKGGAWSKMNDYYFSFCGAMDNLVAYPTWQAAFDTASEKFLLPDGSVDEEKAIDFADSTVRRVLGAGRAKDLPNAMKGSEMKRFWTMFYTWANKFENQMMELQDKTGMDGLKDPRMIAELMRAMLLLVAIPAYLSMFLYKRRLPEDEEWATWLFAYRLQGLPLVRDITSFLTGYDTRMPLSEAVKSFASVGRDFGKVAGWALDGEDLDAYKIFKHVGTAAGYIVGLPTNQAFVTIDGALDLMSGKSDNPLDLLFRAPKDTKKDEQYY